MSDATTRPDGCPMHYFAFYKGMGKGKGLDEKIIASGIALRSVSVITHVELYFPDGMSWSSSGMDGGVRYKKIGYSHPERWKFVPIPEIDTEFKAQMVRRRCDSIEGAPYDNLAIWLHEFLPFGIQRKGAWYCSEACTYAANWSPLQQNPKQLYRMAKKRMLIYYGT